VGHPDIRSHVRDFTFSSLSEGSVDQVSLSSAEQMICEVGMAFSDQSLWKQIIIV
jgi:hypothetical protein